ncbi:MAG: hypothetical protein HYZ53_17875 [Planctomycetes bacterium]|nr:hypothetical protein [Planctomycetota bacterium]
MRIPRPRARPLPLVAATLAALLMTRSGRAPAQEDPSAPPPGPHLPLRDASALPASLSLRGRTVAAYYFYWYDDATQAHVVDPDGTDALQDHPARRKGFSYADPAWHFRELSDLREAGIDLVLPVFWGVPGRHDDWNFVGLRALVAALDRLADPPRVGLFYDTTTLQGIDLTAEDGRLRFYRTVRDFYSMIPPAHWARLDGKPLVWLYSSHFPKAVDAGAFARLREALKTDFAGLDVFVIGDPGWARRARASVLDATYDWGAALGGPRIHPVVAAVGPGYDDSAVPGRRTPKRDREGGRFYERGWRRVLRSDAAIAVVETWNEFHEGTDVCESREYGRAYIEATARFADLFRRRERPPRPQGEYADARETTWRPGEARGLRAVDWEDGLFDLAEGVLRTRENRFSPYRYAYFDVDDDFAPEEPADLEVSAEVLDDGTGIVQLSYNGADDVYVRGPRIRLTDTRAWRKLVFPLRGALLRNAQNGGADFRFAIGEQDLSIRRVVVRRRE